MATGADGPTVAAATSGGREPLPPTWDGSEPGTEFPGSKRMCAFGSLNRSWRAESEELAC